MTWQLGVTTGVVAVWALFGLATAVRAGARALRRRREARRRAVQGDPLETLVLQLRLGQIARELQALADHPGYAAAHHVRAAQHAYDALLVEACRRAGLEVEDAPLRPGVRSAEEVRLREELELASRGWSW